MAKKEPQPLVLTPWEDNLCAVIRSRQPGVVIHTTEEVRALNSLNNIYLYMALANLGKRDIFVWSPVSYKKYDIVAKHDNPDYKPELLDWKELVPTLKNYANDTGTEEKPNYACLLLADVADQLQSPKAVRQLRETLWAVRGSFRNIVLIGNAYDLPAQIAPDFSIQRFELPTSKDLQTILTPTIVNFRTAAAYKGMVKIDDSSITRFMRACAGLTEAESRSLLGLSISRFHALDDRAVQMALKEKAQIVRRSNVLEYKTVEGDLDRVGGAAFVKAWIKELDDLVKREDEVKMYGLKMPKGMLLIGPPGGGKSLLSEMLAGHWRLPLLVFDVGRAFGSLVGESESRIDQVIELAKACAPAIVVIDEIEKALGGGGGEMDGGTSQRVKGKLLTWLQNKPEGIFIVATANDVTKFETSPELIRAGRFDAIFSVDLPDMRSRIEIFGIHYRLAIAEAKSRGECKLAESIPSDVFVEAAKMSKGYSGAELEVAMQAALRAAFRAQASHPTADMLCNAIKNQRPLSVTMKESIDRIRAWAKDGRALPAGATIEDDKSDTKAYEDLGLPQLFSEK